MALPTTPIVSGAAVRPDPPVPADYGLVVRGVGLFQVIEPYLQRRFDIGVTVIYVGYAALGVVDADPAWTIKKIVLIGGYPVSLQWSSPTTAWTLRVAGPYS